MGTEPLRTFLLAFQHLLREKYDFCQRRGKKVRFFHKNFRQTPDSGAQNSGSAQGTRIVDLRVEELGPQVSSLRTQGTQDSGPARQVSGLRAQVPSMTPDVGHRCICSLILVIPFDKKQILYLKSAFHTLQYNEFTDTMLLQFHHGPQLQQNLEKAD